MSKKNWVYIIVGLAIITVILNWDAIKAFFVRKTNGIKAGTDANELIKKVAVSGTAGNGYTAGNTAQALQPNMLLKRGMKGPEVKALQALSNAAQALMPIATDGSYGPATETKVYQVFGVKEISLGAAVTQFKLTYPNWPNITNAYVKTILALVNVDQVIDW